MTLEEGIAQASSTMKFVCNPKDFFRIPACTFAYWVSPSIVALFESSPKVQADGREAVIGASTKDDFRFLRLAWEVSNVNRAEIGTEHLVESGTWIPFAKGGAVIRYYGDLDLLINWADNGLELKALISEYRGSRGWGYQWSAELKPRSFSFRPGLTWGRRSTTLAFRLLPANAMFADKGPAILDAENSPATLTSLIAILNSQAFVALASVQVARVSLAQSFEIGLIQSTPIPVLDGKIKEYLARIIKKVWLRFREIDSVKGTSNAFTVPALLATSGGSTLAERSVTWATHVHTREETVVSIQAEIDDIAFRLYGLAPTDRAALTAPLCSRATSEVGAEADDNEEAEATIANAPALVADLLGYIIGTVFGRWDIRYATGERPAPELPDPFAPLPVCPPGMLQGDDGLPLALEAGRQLQATGHYPLDIAWGGILVDDPSHPFDLEHRLHEVFIVLWNDRSEAIEQEACELLGIKSLRDYFRKPSGFFADHLKRFSKSRRQAPIYWPLSTAKGSYTLWIYYHSLSDQTLHTALADFVDPKIKNVRAEISLLRESNNNRGRLEELLDLEGELLDFRAEIERIIKLPWQPNLNDGVLITAAPLWRLFRLPKWQKDLKACWDKLEKGEYDWAHLAYSIWPKRVEEVCKKDRSIAIAHGLEHLCQVEPPKPKAKRDRKKAE
ncbi:MAG: hypothetical protein BWK76_05980 [Desulfobulbaceae bacterium A2]|nr:MAG: hypothetical protein BWK76_05980 [Desulfobulbaceae bacterium A2]